MQDGRGVVAALRTFLFGLSSVIQNPPSQRTLRERCRALNFTGNREVVE
jgi:hypothetical protein